MALLRLTMILASLGTLAACSGTSQDDATFSGFATPSASGSINVGLSQTRTGGPSDSDGEGFAYQSGVRDGAGLEAVAGLLPGTDTASWPGTGTATYVGSYAMTVITDISLSSGGFITGLPTEESGQMVLTADFANNSLTGSSDNFLLSIDGQMNGRFMTGTATYAGLGLNTSVTGPLEGRAGSDQAFGVFHGNGADLIFAGGFIADRTQ